MRVAVQREDHVPLAVEAITFDGDADAVAAIRLRNADNAQIGFHANIVRLVPARDLLTAMEGSSPVGQGCVGGKGAKKRFGITFIGGFDKAANGRGCGHQSNLCIRSSSSQRPKK